MSSGPSLNRTDYELPEMWGKFSKEEKYIWYCRRRQYKQAIRQDTAFGRRHDEAVKEAKRLDTDEYRFDK